MADLSARARANMDFVLEEVCRELPHGSDHESRRFVAEQLLRAAEEGRFTVAELTDVARQAMLDLKHSPKSE